MIKHTKVSSAPSDGTSGVQGSDWNADHTIDDAAGLSATLGVHVVAGDPNGTLSGALGELARDTVNAQLWQCTGGATWTALVRADGGTPGVMLDGLRLTNNTSPSFGPEMDFIGYNSDWVMGIDVANSPASRDFVTGVRGSYSFPDGATTSGSPTLTSSSAGNFVTALVGASISGPGIPNGATISSVAGLTSLTMSANATATASGVHVTITRSTVQDLAYWNHRGGLSPTLGIGVTPPDGAARLQVSSQDDEPAMGTLRLRRGPGQTGNVFTVHDSNPMDQVWLDKDFFWSAVNGVRFAAEPSALGQCVVLTDNTKAAQYAFGLPTATGDVLRLRYNTAALTIADFGTDGSTRFLGTVRTSAALRFDSELSPASIGADQNDYNPGSLANAAVLMLTASTAVNITGLTSSSVSGRTLWIYNVGSNNFTLKHQSSSSAAANRFIGRGGADTVLTPNTGAQLFWSSSQTRWVILGDTL